MGHKDPAKQREYRRKNADKVRQWKKNDRLKNAAYYKAYREARHEKDKTIRRAHHLNRYGLTIEEYDALFEKQGGVCAICKNQHRGRGENLHVDHDHVTNKVRGLLCGWCNSALGYMEDNVDRIKDAIDYLNLAKQRPSR